MRSLVILSYLSLADKLAKTKADPAEIAEEDAMAKAGDATGDAELEAEGTGAPVPEAKKEVEGGCSTTDPAQLPDGQDCKADAVTSASFPATKIGGEPNLESCASEARVLCGDKVAFVTFHAGEEGYHAGEGICSWYSAGGCGCVETDSCTQGTKTTGAALETRKLSANVDTLLDTVADGGIPPVGGNEEQAATAEDPNYIKALQEVTLKGSEAPEAIALGTIPSAAEEDMPEGSAEREAESDAVGETQISCPSSRPIAVFRKEWQCIMKGGFQFGTFAGVLFGSLVVAGGIAYKLALVGRNMREDKGLTYGFDIDGDTD